MANSKNDFERAIGCEYHDTLKVRSRHKEPASMWKVYIGMAIVIGWMLVEIAARNGWL